MLRDSLLAVDKLSAPETLPMPITKTPTSKALLEIREEPVIHRRFDKLFHMSNDILQSVIAEAPRDIAEIVAKKIIQDHDYKSKHFQPLKEVVKKIQALNPEYNNVFIEALRTVLTQDQVDHAFDKYRSNADPLTNMLITCGVSSKNLLSAIEHYAIEYSAPYFNALLERKSDPNFKESVQRAVEIFFSRNAYFSNEIMRDVKSPMIDSLIEKMPGNTDILGCALLHVVNKGDKHFKHDVVKKLIDAHASLSWTLNANHYTALHCAVDVGCFDDNDLLILEMLLKAGFDATVRQSAAHVASQNEYSFASALILNFDDNHIRNMLLDYTGRYELSLLNMMYYILRKEHDMLQNILQEENIAKREAKFKESVLALAKKNKFDTAMELIKECSFPFVVQEKSYLSFYYLYARYQDKDGNTLLHYAAMHGNSDAVHKLLNEGFSRTIVNNQGKTPARLALENGYIDIARTLGDKRLVRCWGWKEAAIIQRADMAVAGNFTQIKAMANDYDSNRIYNLAMIFYCLAAAYSVDQDEKLMYIKYIEKRDINKLNFIFNGSKKRLELQLLKDFLLNHCLKANTLSELIKKHPDKDPLTLMLFIMKNMQTDVDKQKETQIKLEESLQYMMHEQMHMDDNEIYHEMRRIQGEIAKIPSVSTCDEQKFDSTPVKVQPVEKADIPVALTASPTVPKESPLIQQENTVSSRYSGTLFAGNELTMKLIPGIAPDLHALEEKERRLTQQ